MTFCLHVDHVTVRRGKVELLHDVSLRIGSGEFVALVGPNGGGKTTLLKVAAGLEPPTSGRILLAGDDAAKMTAHARASRVAWLPQQALISDALSAADVVTSARYRFSETHAESAAAARRALGGLGVEAMSDTWVSTMSGGEQQRVAMATLLAQEATLLLLDEPANHLDPAQQMQIFVLLGRLWRRGLAVVCVTHDTNLLRFLPQGCPVRLIGLKEGALQFDISYDAPTLGAELGRLFGVAMQAVGPPSCRLYVPEPPPACRASAAGDPNVP